MQTAAIVEDVIKSAASKAVTKEVVGELTCENDDSVNSKTKEDDLELQRKHEDVQARVNDLTAFCYLLEQNLPDDDD